MGPDRSDYLRDLERLVELLACERFGEDGAADVLRDVRGDEDGLLAAYRALANVREPRPAAPDLLAVQDRVLRARLARVGVTDAATLPRADMDPRLSLWRGDITTLDVDAIVNAANSQMLGCWVPGHHCIDNAIHSFAGIQLRIGCAELMAAQGHEEPTGQAKVTPGFNLPARHVIHTVGPIVRWTLGDDDRAALASCYASCLDAAAASGCGSVAFCCISTGLFGFPGEAAAPLAVATVRSWLDAHPGSGVTHVVFDVFGEKDEVLYRAALR